MAAVRFFRVTALPASPISDALYFVKPDIDSDHVELFITGIDAEPIPVANADMVETISAALVASALSAYQPPSQIDDALSTSAAKTWSIDKIKSALAALPPSGATIDDALTASTTKTYSVSKIKQTVTDAVTPVAGNLSALSAQVSAIVPGAQIDDAAASSSTKTWSVNKIAQAVADAVDSIVAGAPAAINTLDELAAAIGDDANFAASVTASLANRVRTDVDAQGLTTQQQSNARANISAASAAELASVVADVASVETAVGDAQTAIATLQDSVSALSSVPAQIAALNTDVDGLQDSVAAMAGLPAQLETISSALSALTDRVTVLENTTGGLIEPTLDGAFPELEDGVEFDVTFQLTAGVEPVVMSNFSGPSWMTGAVVGGDTPTFTGVAAPNA